MASGQHYRSDRNEDDEAESTSSSDQSEEDLIFKFEDMMGEEETKNNSQASSASPQAYGIPPPPYTASPHPSEIPASTSPHVAKPKPVSPALPGPSGMRRAAGDIGGHTVEEVSTQLAQLNRKIRSVCPDGNCMFASVAKQLKDPKLNHTNLRKLTYTTGMSNLSKYSGFLLGGDKVLTQGLEKLKENGVWNTDVGDVAISILADAIRKKIVVLSNRLPPLHFPDSDKEITPDTIVVVHDQVAKHYDATCTKGKDVTPSFPVTRSTETTPILSQPKSYRAMTTTYESHCRVIDQLDELSLNIDRVPITGDAVFECISRQLVLSKHMTPSQLRKTVVKVGKACPRKYAAFRDGNETKLLMDLNDLAIDGYWKDELEEMVLNLLSTCLDISIVVLGNFQTPRSYTVAKPESRVVLVYDKLRSHYNSVTPQSAPGCFHWGCKKRKTGKSCLRGSICGWFDDADSDDEEKKSFF